MDTITIRINNDTLTEKVLWLLNHIKEDGLEIIINNDIEDLEFLKATRNDKSIPFDEYSRNNDKVK
ncbi:MAG: hypothetical protein HQK61_03170 [Desulfamplus sp.]|nr:hypothetical protein [Desulfamplus sp.]